MNVLGIRTDSGNVQFVVSDGSKKVVDNWKADRELAAGIHEHINLLIKKLDLDIGDIEGIVFYKGPGSFTGLRIGASVANALAMANNIKIANTDDVDWFEQGCELIFAGSTENQTSIFYGAEPNVTLQKK